MSCAASARAPCQAASSPARFAYQLMITSQITDSRHHTIVGTDNTSHTRTRHACTRCQNAPERAEDMSLSDSVHALAEAELRLRDLYDALVEVDRQIKAQAAMVELLSASMGTSIEALVANAIGSYDGPIPPTLGHIATGNAALDEATLSLNDASKATLDAINNYGQARRRILALLAKFN